jgi:hypothetical protein
MAASGKLTLKLNPEQFHQAERIAQQQLYGVEKTSSQLLMTVASRLHERLAASVSAKLASSDTSESIKKASHEYATSLPVGGTELPALVGDEGGHGPRLSASGPIPSEEGEIAANPSIINTWKGFPRNVPYYLPLISTLAGMVRKNTVSLLLHLMTEWLPQRHVLAAGAIELSSTSSSASASAGSAFAIGSSTHITTGPGSGRGSETAATPGSAIFSNLASSQTSNSDSFSANTQTTSTNSAGSGYTPFSASPLSFILGEEDSITEAFFSFTSFTSRIQNLKLSDQAQLDLVELVVLQVVADVLSLVLSSITSTRIGLQTLEKLVQISFALVRSSPPRAIDEETWKVLQAPVQSQWSVVLGYLGPLMMPIFTTFMTMSFPKLPSESQAMLLERMHIPLYRAEESNIVAFIMASLPHLMGQTKSTSLKLTQIDTLDRWLMACDMQEGGPLFDKIKDVFKRLMETPSKNEDIDGPTNKLLATILAHSPPSFRDKHIDVILSKTWLKLVWTSKKRDYLECILRVLRGSFLDYHQPSGTIMFPQETAPGSLPSAVIYSPPGIISSTTISVYRPGGSLASKLGIKPSVLPQSLPDTNPFAVPKSGGSSSRPTSPRSKPSSMFEDHWMSQKSILSPYAQCGFTGDREDRMLQRLITINSALFGQKNPLPRLHEQMDICAEIVVQIVAHHIKFGINSVLTPLARGPVYNKMIALHALKRILDPSSGFLQTAFCFQHAFSGGVGGSGERTESEGVHVEEEDLKALQQLLVELVTESLTYAQKQMKDARKEDPMGTFPLQPHAQTCYADLELLHELSSKQQLNTTSTSAVKGCFERVRQLVLMGGPQTWLARQKEVDQNHLVLVDMISKWMNYSGIPAGYYSGDVNTGAASDESSEKSSEKDKATDKSNPTSSATATISVPLSSSQPHPVIGTPATTRKWPAIWAFAKKKGTVQPEKFTLADVAREAVGCLDLALASVHVLQPGDDLFIGNLLLHHDEDVAQTCSLQLQQAMLTRPNLRPVILKSLCQMATSLITNAWALYAPSHIRCFSSSAGHLIAETNNILAILAQVLLFVDLWNLASLLKTKSSTGSSKPESTYTPPPSLLDELDALAFICLASNVPMTRYTAIQLANSLDALRETFGLPNRGVAWCIRQVEVPLLQRARFAFLKETAQGVDSKVTVKNDNMSLKIETAASSHHDSFWPHVLAELAHALVDSPNTYQTVVAARFLVNQFTAVWRTVVSSNGISIDYKALPLHQDFPILYKHVHILMFATMSVPLYTTSGIPTTLSMFSKTAGWTPSTNTLIVQQPPTLSPTVMLSAQSLRKSTPTLQMASGPTSYPTTSTPPQTTIDDIPTDAAALRHADERLSQVVSQANSYVASLFKGMEMEDEALVESVCFAASYIHWRSMLVVAAQAWRWYQGLSSKPGLSKKRLKVRPFLASLFRRMMRHQTQFQWAIRCPSPAWIFFIAPLAELSQSGQSSVGTHRATSPRNAHPLGPLPPLPPIYLHLQSVASQKSVGMPSHDSMLQIAQQRSTSIEDGPVGPLLLLLPRIFFEFLADMGPNLISEHSKSSSFEAGQYFIDNASMLSRLNSALTDIPMVCCRTGALRQYLSPSQNRDAILTILASGTSSALLSVAASGGSSLGNASSSSSGSRPDAGSFGTISSLGSSLSMTDGPSMFGTLSGASAAAVLASSTSPNPAHHHGRTVSVSAPSSRDTPPPIHINWAELTDMLLTWSPVGKASAARVAMDQMELSKLVARVKNAARKDERKTHAQYFLTSVAGAALSALMRLAQCGLSVPSSVVDKRDVASKVLLDWVLPADRGHGLRFLRWLLASHLDVLLPVYIDRALGRERAADSKDASSKDSSIFIHAIYDQFLEDAASAPPDDGITHSTRVFFDRHFQLQKERLRYEKSALKKDDKEFTKVITSCAGQLIHLVLLNLSHASALIRTRSFELLYRLGPIAFGMSHSLADYDLAKRFQDLRDAFISRMEGISRDRALEVSQLLSMCCGRYTEDLFAEAFTRFKGLNSSNRSWSLHFLSCWAHQIILQPSKARAPILLNDRDRTPWKIFSTDSFLHHIYSKLTLATDTTDKGHGRVPLLALWLNLANAANGVNIPAIVEYLLAKSVISKNDLAICKLILLELYRSHPDITCSLLVQKLRVSGAIEDFHHWTGTSKSYNVNSTMLTGLGIGVTAFEVILNKVASSNAATQTAPPSASSSKSNKGMVRDQSSQSVDKQQQSGQEGAGFEEVPVPDAVSANAAWSAVIGKKSVQTKWSPHALMRDAIVSILADLLIEDVRPALPHLAIICNYALLKFDHQVAHLLYSALVPIRTLLKDSDRKRAKDLIRTNGILDTLITLLKHSTFKMSWQCESNATSASSNTAQATGSIAPNAAPPTVVSSPHHASSPMAHGPSATNTIVSPLQRGVSGNLTLYNPPQSGQAHDGLGPNLIEWAAAIKPGYLVNVMCQCASLLYETTTKMQWANELVQWIVQSVDSPSTDLAASTKALELCRAVLESSASHKDWSANASEPNSPRSEGRASVDPFQSAQGIFQDEDSEFLRVPPSVISLIQAAFLETLLFLDRALRTSQHSSWVASSSLRDKLRHQENITMLRARTEDMLSMLTLMVPHLEKSSSLVDLLFVGISVLRLSPGGFASFFEKGIHLVQSVVSDSRFQDVDGVESRLKRHLKGANMWDFPGLIPLALRGWYSQRTERFSGTLITDLVSLPHDSLVTPRIDPALLSSKKFYSHATEGDGATPHWLNAVLVLVGILPWLHYSITSLSARKEDEYTTSVSDTCTSLSSILEKSCDKETLLGGGDIVPAALMPIRNALSALANRQTNYGGYYDKAGEASRFVQEVFKKLVLLQNIFSPLSHTVGELLAQLVVEAPAKLTESILFVHEAFRSSAIPYLQEKPAMNIKVLDIRNVPRFTVEAVGAIYKHMFEVERSPIITEASFRIGGTPSNDAQARSSILSVMNALYAYPSGWPSSLIEHSDVALESPRGNRRQSLALVQDEVQIDEQTGEVSRVPTPVVHPLTRSAQMVSKMELVLHGGLKAAIDALRTTIIKPKSKKKAKHASSSPVPSVVISSGSSKSGEMTTGTTRRRKGEYGNKVKSHEKTKTSTSDPATPQGTTRGLPLGVGGGASGQDQRTGSGPLNTLSHSQSASAVKGAAAAAGGGGGGGSGGKAAYGNIQIHFERNNGTSSGGGGNSVRVKTGSTSSSASGSGRRGSHVRGDSDDMMLMDDLADVLDDLEEELNALTLDDIELFRLALLDEELDEVIDVDQDVENDGEDDDSDDSDDGLREEFFKQFNLEGVNLAAFTSPRGKHLGGGAPGDEESGMESGTDFSMPPDSARSAGPMSARKSKSESKRHSRVNSNGSSGLDEGTDNELLDFGGFGADDISRALAGLSNYEIVPVEEDDEESSVGSDSDSDDDEDRTVVERERSITPQRPRASSNSTSASATMSTSQSVTSKGRGGGYNSEDAESEGSGIESSEDHRAAKKAKRMSVGPVTQPSRERRAFKKRSTQQVSETNLLVPSQPSQSSPPHASSSQNESSSSEDDMPSAKSKKEPRSKSSSLARVASISQKQGAPPVVTPVPASALPRSASPRHTRMPSTPAKTHSSMTTASSSSNDPLSKSTPLPAVSAASGKSSSGSGKTSSSSGKSSKSSTNDASSSSSSSSSQAAASSSSSSSKSSSISRRLFGRGVSSAEVSGAAMRKIIDDPKSIAKFLSWMKHNNLDSDVLSLVLAVKEFRSVSDASKRTTIAKRLIDTYFKPKRGLSTLTEAIRSETYNSFQALDGQHPPTTFFDTAESYCVDHLTKNHYVMFTKSPFHQ